MKKRRGKYLLLAVLTIITTMIVSAYPNNDWNSFLNYASGRYGVPRMDITVLSFTAKQASIGLGAPIPMPYWIHTPAWMSLQIGDITLKLTFTDYENGVICDDYYFDELYEKLNKFCAKQLGVEEVLFCPEKSDIASLLMNYPISEIDEEVLINFFNLRRGTQESLIFIPVDNAPEENFIKAVIDNLVQIDDEYNQYFSLYFCIIFVESTENIAVTREAKDDRNFDNLHYDGPDAIRKYCEIQTREKRGSYKEYNGYYYNLP